ncbi:hypothetical protein AC1031_004874 [Aphanomyces cochlioides]|nr:hypothetical protein AC1031_004874 [Aphanomyces cochlioides]
MDRIYMKLTATLDGKNDPAKSEWSGPNILFYDNGDETKFKIRYKFPTWPCTKCAKPVPIENTLCFGCDKTPRNSVQPLDLPIEVEAVRRQIHAREHISNLLNQMDQRGRTVLMYAAENGHLGILEELLPFMSPNDIRTNDNHGKTALDLALARKLVCTKNPLDLSNDETLTCVELIRRRSSLQIKPTIDPHSFGFDSTCHGDCDAANQISKKNTKNDCLCDLAKSKKWGELEEIFTAPVSGDVLNAKDDDTGDTVAHVLCREGKVKLLELLLKQSALDLEIPNNCYKYPLYEAMKKDRVGCEADESNDYQLALLNKKAKCYQMIMDKFALMEQDRLSLYYQANVPSIYVAEKHRQAKQSALHAAILHNQSKSVVDEISQDELIDVDEKDEDGNTALILAVQSKSKLAEDYVDILLLSEADIDATNNENRTALMIAAVDGNVAVVELLLQNMAEIDIQDKDGKTCLDLVEQLTLGSLKTGSMSELVTPHTKIKSLLTAEKQTRANSVDFRDKLVKTSVGMTSEEAFLQGGFRKTVNCSPKLARSFLDDCVVINRHDVEFSQLKEIYGEDVETSVLNSILNLKSDDPDFVMEARKECLEHVVMRRVMEIKRELFGQRKYLEQLIMNMLLLVTSTISSISFDEKLNYGDESSNLPRELLTIGLAAVLFALLGFIFVQLLRPRYLWQISRYLYDGNYAFDPQLELPNLPVKKQRAKMLIVYAISLSTLVVAIPILCLMKWHNILRYFPIFNNVVLWLTVSFFLVTEVQEARAGVAKYFKSDINKAQMAIYLIIFFVFVPLKLNIVTFGMLPDTLMSVEVGIGSFISIMLWVLTVQFLEVVPSASYLLPMMSNLLQDVWNFFILFGVPNGLITFYQLFKQTDDESFATITQSFITTYFVTFGQLPLDSLKAFDEDKEAQKGKNNFLATCAVLLMMFHAAVVVVLLLNMLLAMMNKTFETGVEEAKTEALASYAKCIIRLEESMNKDKHGIIDLIHFKDVNGQLVLNPIFNETVPKPQLQIPDEQEAAINAYQKTKTEWIELIDDLNSISVDELQKLEGGLLHTQHFVTFDVTAVLHGEFDLIKQTRAHFDEYVEMAKKTRGQDPANALKKLDGLVKKEVIKFEDDMKREWHSKKKSFEHKQCVLVHQMAFKANLDDLLSTFKSNILFHYESILARESEKAEEPTLNDHSTRRVGERNHLTKKWPNMKKEGKRWLPTWTSSCNLC